MIGCPYNLRKKGYAWSNAKDLRVEYPKESLKTA